MPTIGIDLGTTNSLVSYWTDDGPKIIPNGLGDNITPSVVSIDENGEIYVGQIAKERIITHPHLTASTFKRYMGTEKMYKLGRHSFRPEELSSFVLKALKADAEAFFNQNIDEAVISVPAYFNDSQRRATKHAAELAGLRVERLISEPTAAAIAYGLHQEKTETKFLVFDLGGGTFDVSILEMFENIMEVKSVAGDNFLGGEDFTNLLVDFFIKSNGIDINMLDSKINSAINKQAELCKCNLSQSASGKMSIIINNEKLETVIDRAEFEKLANPLLLRLRNPIDRALRDAALSPEDIDAIILIGGATRMPVIRTVVSKMFGRIPVSNINPDETVALGAAIQSALKARNQALDEVIMTDVCPYSLGTNVVKQISDRKYEAGYFFPIIERNTPIPVSRVERLATVHDGQSQIIVDVYQGESRRVENNIKLGELEIQVTPAPAGEQLFDVRYTYDINGILEVEVTTIKTGIKNSLVIEKNTGTMSKEQIKERLKELEKLKIHPRERMENKLLIARAERMYEEYLGEARNFIANLLEKFEGVLSLQDDRKIKKAAEEFKRAIDEIEGWNEF